jgi:hypothetical protein
MLFELEYSRKAYYELTIILYINHESISEIYDKDLH